ncbi:hypothetical protein DBB36_01015 [Flavobacterium sp. WLB]|nr:hypothetical protein AKO67_07180 [Flavobacterium sp. VMW]OWU92753.1 hypothetical protein APR43_01445 [Flavobacterium sp. NLM]PUU71962.1 hypothetical protein DBB36_01015 [Flavobacterium sp. WLB]
MSIGKKKNRKYKILFLINFGLIKVILIVSYVLLPFPWQFFILQIDVTSLKEIILLTVVRFVFGLN